MVAPIIAAAGAALRGGAMAVGRGAAVAGRAAGTAAKAGARAGAKAASRGTRSAARGAGRSAKGVARRGGKTAAGASKRAGSGAKDLARPTARGPGSATRNGWNYRNPNQPNTPSVSQGPTGAQVKKFLSNRLRRMLLMRAWRKSRKDRKDPKSKIGKARAKARRARRRVRRVLVFAFLLMVVFPVVIAGTTGAQMNDAIASSNGDEEQQLPAPLGGLGPPGGPRGGTERYTERGLPPRTQRLVDTAVPEFGRGYGLHCFGGRRGPSEHPSGRACDFMMAKFGTKAAGDDLAHGNAMAAWLQANAAELDIMYIIWQNRIWSQARADEGWRHHHDDTGQGNTFLHYDHIHVSLN